MSPVSPLAPPSSSAFPRCPGRRPGGLAGGRGRGSGRPCRRRQGQSQPRPRTEPVDCGWACGRRTGGARAGCGRERGHCVPPPSNSPRCHGTSPFPSPSPRTQCPRHSLPERCRRLDIAAFSLFLHVPRLGSDLPANPALPLGVARRGGWGVG